MRCANFAFLNEYLGLRCFFLRLNVKNYYDTLEKYFGLYIFISIFSKLDTVLHSEHFSASSHTLFIRLGGFKSYEIIKNA